MRTTLISLVFLLIFLISVPFISVSTVSASGWSGWDSIDTIYYNPSQEEANNTYLETAANDLQALLDAAGKTLSIETESEPESGAIFLIVDSSIGASNGTFRLLSDNTGIHITGHTAIACRHGAYELLERLGFRWFFKSDIWHITPDSIDDLGDLDVTLAPDFDYRGLVWMSMDNVDETEVWSRRNRVPGEAVYPAGHAYFTLAPPETYYEDYPDWYIGAEVPPAGETGYQLDPYDNPDLIAIAVTYAENLLSNETVSPIGSGDTITYGSASMTPNDGGGWEPPYDESDRDNITDIVFYFANEVAKGISSSYPNSYISCLSYYIHSSLPSIDLEPNVLIWVTNGYNYSGCPTYSRFQGIAEKASKVGLYDYTEDWTFHQDAPPEQALDWEVIESYNALHKIGNITSFVTGAVGDGWGGRGLLKYILTKFLWDTSVDINSLKTDFYEKSFGNAATDMQFYHEVMSSYLGKDNWTLKNMYDYLNAAVVSAAGDDDSLARIRYMVYYTHFLWNYHNIGLENLTQQECEDFYTFITKIRYLYVVYYKSAEAAVRDILEDTWELSSEEVDALQDFTEPTAQEAADWLAAGTAYFCGLAETELIRHINPRYLTLVALGDNTAAVDPMRTGDQHIIIPSDGNETITIQVKGHGTVKWFSPLCIWLDSEEVDSDDDYTDITFDTTDAGYYILQTCYLRQTDFIGYVQVPNRPAGIMVDSGALWSSDEPLPMSAPKFWFENECYFYVPNGTKMFKFGADKTATYEPYGTLTDPDAGETEWTWDDFDANEEMLIEDPVPGLWHLLINKPSREGRFWFQGIPPLVWYDPEYLLVPVAGPNSPPFANNQSVTTDEDVPLSITLSASDLDGDSLTYEIVTNPSNGTLSGTSPALTYTPHPDFSGSDSFTFAASDSDSTSNTAIVSIIVNPVDDSPPPIGGGGGGVPPPSNSPPSASSQAITTDEDTSVEVTLSASDADGDSLTYEIATNPSDGTLSGTPPVLIYTPNPDFNGLDSFTFTASDDEATSEITSITITVNPIDELPPPPIPHPNSLPLTSPQVITTEEDTSVEITLSASDPDGNPLTYEIVTNPSNGTLSGIPPIVTYTPNPDFNGLDSFTFIASDGTATSSPATISIDVMRVGDKILSLETSNSLPSAYFQILDTAQNLPINITLKAEGADGDSLTYTIITSPSNGILSGNPPVLTYTPDHDFIGTDSFAFVVSDEISTSNTATVIIGVSRETQGLTIPFGEDWKIGNFPIIFLLVPPVVIVLTLVGFIYQHTRANGRYKRPQLHYFTTSINVLNSRKR